MGVSALQGGRVVAWDFVDERGRFEIGGLLPGNATVRVDVDGEFEPLELRVRAGERDLRLVLTRRR